MEFKSSTNVPQSWLVMESIAVYLCWGFFFKMDNPDLRVEILAIQLTYEVMKV